MPPNFPFIKDVGILAAASFTLCETRPNVHALNLFGQMALEHKSGFKETRPLLDRACSARKHYHAQANLLRATMISGSGGHSEDRRFP